MHNDLRGERAMRGIPCAFLRCPPGDPTARGIVYDHRTIGAVAVEHLLSLILFHQTGLPSVPREIQIAGTWTEGSPHTSDRARMAARPCRPA